MNMTGHKISFGDILTEFLALARRQLGSLAAYSLVMATVMSAVVRTLSTSAASLVSGLIGLGAMFAFTVILMQREGLVNPDAGKPSFMSYFGAGILSGLGIGLGTLFFVVPGFYLLARWSVSYQFVIGEGKFPSAALDASRQATQEAVWVIAAFYFVALIVGIGGVVGVGMLVGRASGGALGLMGDFVAELAVDVFQALGVVLAIAIYRLVKPQTGELVDVFA